MAKAKIVKCSVEETKDTNKEDGYIFSANDKTNKQTLTQVHLLLFSIDFLDSNL